jgi:hypothetical protein
MVNENEKYCSNFTLKKWTLFYILYFFGRFRLCDLPSFHPYFKKLIKKNNAKKIKDLKAKLKDCKKDNSKIAYYFNRDTTIKDIEDKIKKL